MNWNARLTQARTAKNIKKIDLAKQLGVSPATITQWETGLTKEIKGENLTNLCRALEVNPDWLLYGVGTSSSGSVTIPGAAQVVVAESGDPNFYHIPKVKLQLRAGITGFETVPEIYDGSTLAVPKNWADRHGFVPATLIALSVKGESMEPSLYEGDVVIINTADRTMADGVVFAVNYEGEAVIKRLTRDAGQWWLSSDNSDQRKYHRKSCRGGDCIIVGRVVRRETDRI